jgi:hypothetical protein
MMAQPEIQPEALSAYVDHWQHLADELQWLELLLQRQVAMLRAQTLPAQRLAVNRQVCIAHEEIDWLLGNEKPPGMETREADGIHRRLERFRNRI